MKAKHLSYILAFTFIILGFFQAATGLKLASKAWLSQYLIDQAWSRTLAGEREVQPWPWADTWPVAELSVPKLDVSQVVLSGDSGRVLAFGPGMSRYMDTGLSREMTFVSGHRDTHFSFLREIETEDVLNLKSFDGHSQWYQVVDTLVVDENWQVPEQVADDSNLLILVTCFPFDENSAQSDKRLLVFATHVNESDIKKT